MYVSLALDDGTCLRSFVEGLSPLVRWSSQSNSFINCLQAEYIATLNTSLKLLPFLVAQITQGISQNQLSERV